MICYIFQGQGTQVVGMGTQLFPHFADLCHVADQVLGYSLQESCLDRSKLSQTLYTQPALYCVSAFRYLKKIQTESLPHYLIGHSLGELVALFAAGVYDFATGLRLTQYRAKLMSQAENGAMLAVIGLDKAVVQSLVSSHARRVVIANFNSPTQFVLSGPAEAIRDMEKIFQPLAKKCVLLPVSGAFHSDLMREASDQFFQEAKKIPFRRPFIPVLSNLTGTEYEFDEIASILSKQIKSPVQFSTCIEYLLKRGVNKWEELGDHLVLTPLIEEIKNYSQCLA